MPLIQAAVCPLRHGSACIPAAVPMCRGRMGVALRQLKSPELP